MESSDIDALFELLNNRYGDRLTADQLEEIKKTVEEQAEHAEKLRSVHLENGDEPAFVFTPYRAED